jgi:phage pi2 protein 07
MQDIFTLHQIETELQKRLAYPYHWGKKQNNADDNSTNFIYDILYFEDVLAELDRQFAKKSDYQALFNYSLNRWYNFWSAQAIERIFEEHPTVKKSLNSTHRFVDFDIKGVPFDHKSSVFPKNYPQNIDFAIENPQHLVEWLYTHQSQERRLHFKNRIFIVFYDSKGEHWKLKAEILQLKNLIYTFLQEFSFHKLLHLDLDGQTATLAGVIWARNDVLIT